jgi:glycosyltransferase involved in cell wall biosynthesis
MTTNSTLHTPHSTLPKISIIIPIYNAGKYLRPALESVAAQTFADFECICVDDGSTDSSADVVREFAAKDLRFVLIEQENSGVSAARNAGLDAARGEFLTFLDQDDLIAPDSFAIYMELAEKYGTGMIRGGYEYVPENFKLESMPADSMAVGPRFYEDVDAGLADIMSRKRIKKWFYIWNCLFRKEVIGKIRFLPKVIGEDLIFMAEVYNNLKNFVQFENTVCFHRRSATSLTLNGLRPELIERFLTTTPIFYKRYMDSKTKMNGMFFWWEINDIYSLVVKAPLKQGKYIELSQKTLNGLKQSGALQTYLLNWKRRMFLNLFMNGHIRFVWVLMKVI